MAVVKLHNISRFIGVLFGVVEQLVVRKSISQLTDYYLAIIIWFRVVSVIFVNLDSPHLQAVGDCVISAERSVHPYRNLAGHQYSDRYYLVLKFVDTFNFYLFIRLHKLATHLHLNSFLLIKIILMRIWVMAKFRYVWTDLNYRTVIKQISTRVQAKLN